MKSILATVPLYNANTRKFEDATLYRGASADNLAHIETRWRPMLEMRRKVEQETGVAKAEHAAEDAHWDWGRKMLAAEKDPWLYEMFVIECAFSTQAVMLVAKGGITHLCRHPDNSPKDQLIYIDFLATAPWNRRKLVADPAYGGCGRIMVETAVALSLEEEMGGRIGLHALVGAEAFYELKMGMTDLGPDEQYHGLRYFEVSNARATEMTTSPRTSKE